MFVFLWEWYELVWMFVVSGCMIVCVSVCEHAHVRVCFFTCVGAGLLWKLTNSIWGSVYTFPPLLGQYLSAAV